MSNNYNHNLNVGLMASRMQGMLNEEKRNKQPHTSNHNLNVALMASRIQGMNLNSRTAKKPIVLYNAVKKPTLAQGDCFFSAIYRASKEQGLLQKINECSEHDILVTNEDNFITSLRNLVGRNSDDAIRSLYDFLLMLYNSNNQNSKNALKVQMEEPERFDEWHKKLMRKYVLNARPDFDNFLREFKNGIKTRRRYVCDIEILITKDIFEQCGIIIDSYSEMQNKLVKRKRGMDVINLYNCGGAHFEYFSLSPKNGGRRSKTKKVYRKY